MKQVKFWRKGNPRFSVEPYNSVRDGTGGEEEGEGEEGKRKRRSETCLHVMLRSPVAQFACNASSHPRRALPPKVESIWCQGGRNFLHLSKILLAELAIELTLNRLTEQNKI